METLNLYAWQALTFVQTEMGLVTVASVVGAVGFGGALHLYQLHDARALPALPSHEEALVGESNAATRFFAAVHDLTMTVTEAWNVVRTRGKKIEEVIRRSHLEGVVERVHQGATELRAELEPYQRHGESVRQCRKKVKRLWTYKTRDNYRTVTSKDSRGRKTTRKVYEDTDHWFTYREKKLEGAEGALTEWIASVERVTFPTLGLHQRRVDLKKLDATERSFLSRLVKTTITRSEDEPTDEIVERYANQWLLGTRICADLEAFVDGVKEVRVNAERCLDQTRDARPRYHYKTRYRTHEGPPGYQGIQVLLQGMKKSRTAWKSVDTLISGAEHGADQLLAYASDNTTIESDLDYAEIAVNTYNRSFPQSTLPMNRLPALGFSITVGILVFLVVWAVYGGFVLIRG